MREDYVPNLKAPRRKAPSKRMILAIVLCILFPPAGLILLWGGVKCPLRGKLMLTGVSALILVIALTVVLEKRDEDSLIMVQDLTPPVYMTAAPSQTATPVPAPMGDGSTASGVVPANPMG